MFRYLLATYLVFAQSLSAFGEEREAIVVNGTHWLQPVNFINFSWEDVGAICDVSADGRCFGKLGGYDLSGWTWANSRELGALFNFFIGHEEFHASTGGTVHQYFAKDGDWATTFFDAGFKPHKTVGADRHLSAYLRDEVNSEDLTEFRLFGGMSAYFRPYCKSVCNSSEINESWDFHNEGRPPSLGYWFFRR